jgi:DNA-directed RNA polymerase specialized sigma subunit, sigma24 homolog
LSDNNQTNQLLKNGILPFYYNVLLIVIILIVVKQYTNIDIKELGRRIKKRDEKAFRILYVAYFHNLQYYAMRYLYDWEESENLVQDAFMSLWCNIDKYNPEQNIVFLHSCFL